MIKHKIFDAVVLPVLALVFSILAGQAADLPADAAPSAVVAATNTGAVLPDAASATGTVAAVGASLSAIEPAVNDSIPDSDSIWAEPESRTHRAVRLNRTIMMVVVPILAFFILARIALLWKISTNRKRIARETNSLES